MPTASPIEANGRHFLLPRLLSAAFAPALASALMQGGPMKGLFLRFYVQENREHRHILLYEWLLEEAKKLGIQGGTAFRAVAGFGHHGTLHFQHFFELAGDLTMQLDFLVSEEEAQRLLDVIRKEGIRVFYMKVPVEFGVLNPDPLDARAIATEAAEARCGNKEKGAP
jgi:PII-like signaling protein